MAEITNERRFHGKPDRLRSEGRLARLEIDRVVALSVEGLRSGRILDIGTGTGVFAEAFVAKGFSVTGIDVNEALLEAAKEFVPTAEFIQARAEGLPFGNGEFDLSFLGHLLHEADDPVKVLSEARRVSKTRVVVLEWPNVQEEFGPPLDHRLCPEAVLDMVKQVGMTNVEYLRLTHMDLYRMELDSVKP